MVLPNNGMAFLLILIASKTPSHNIIGCDQFIILRDDSSADCLMEIFNADGSISDACGNATRCIGAVLLDETDGETVRVRTGADLLTVSRAGYGLVTVDMGIPRTGWENIPLSAEVDTLNLDLACGPLSGPAAVGMGNPHATFFVEEIDAVPMALVGPELEHNAVFPERANIGVAQILAPDRMRLRVWERGVGLTLACGTGACAAVVNASRRGLGGRRMVVVVDGGELLIDWREEEARRLDRPRSWVVPDKVMVSLAKRQPAHMAQLSTVDGLHDAIIRKRGRRILEVISNASNAQSELPVFWQAPLRSDQKEWASILGEAVAAAAVTLGIAPEILFAGKDIERLIHATLASQKVPEDLLGWRHTVITQHLIALLASLVEPSTEPKGMNEQSH